MCVYGAFLIREIKSTTGFTAPPPLHQEIKIWLQQQQKIMSQQELTKTDSSDSTVNSCSLLRLPHLLWLRHVAQCGAPAPAAEPCEQRQRAAHRQEKQRACCGKGTGAFHGSRKDQSVLKIDQLILGLCRATHVQLYIYLPYLFVQAEHGQPQWPARSLCEDAVSIMPQRPEPAFLCVVELNLRGHKAFLLTTQRRTR